jgi:hypothetical protein
VAGKLIESGIIEVSPHKLQAVRLAELGESFRTEFDTPDILVIEQISPVPYNPRSRFNKIPGMNATSIASLQRAVGAILSAQPWPIVVEIPPMTWKKYVDSDYVKGDNVDAEYIGLAAIRIAGGE